MLEEAHLSERMQKKRQALALEERELLAQLEACEQLIERGQQRLRAAESDSPPEVSGSVVESGASQSYGGDSFASSMTEEIAASRSSAAAVSTAEASIAEESAEGASRRCLELGAQFGGVAQLIDAGCASSTWCGRRALAQPEPACPASPAWQSSPRKRTTWSRSPSAT